jgi:hypothetical protein
VAVFSREMVKAFDEVWFASPTEYAEMAAEEPPNSG